MIIKSKSEIKKVTRGYNCLARTIVFLAENKILTLQEFGFYLLLGLLMDWEPKHINTFGIVKLTPSELSTFLSLNESTIYRQIEKLVERGLVRLERGIIYIRDPERFIRPYAIEIKEHKIANLKELLAKEKEISANVQEKLAKLRQTKEDRADTNLAESIVKPTLGGNHRGVIKNPKDFRDSFNDEYRYSSNEDLSREDMDIIDKHISHSETK